VAAKGSFLLLAPRFGSSLGVLMAICAAVVVYAVLVLALRVITREDLEMIPHGQKLAKLLRIR
jgi:stage V sporulation protein B